MSPGRLHGGKALPDSRQRLARVLRETKQRLVGSGGAAGPGDISAAVPGGRHDAPPATPALPSAEEADILEAIAADAPLPDILRAIALTVDALKPGVVSSILLLDPDGIHVRHGAAPHLPAELVEAFDGKPIGPAAGSCGTAAFTGEPVIATDIATDPRWVEYREPVLALGFRACWSVPVVDSGGRVLATFALYDREPKAPDDSDIETIARFAHLVGIAIERTRQREELRASEERFRSIYRLVPVSIWEEDWTAIVECVAALRRDGVTDFRRHFAGHPDIVRAMLDSLHVLDVNDQTLRIFGVADQAELERKLKAGTLSDDVIGGFGDQVAAMAEGAAIYESERRFRSAAGEPLQALMRLAYPQPGSGSGLVLVSLMDVTAVKQLEAERSSLAERLGATLENMTDAFCLVDRDWRFVYLNAEAERVLKRRRRDLLGRSMWDEFPEARGTEINNMYDEAMRSGAPGRLEFFYPPLGEWFDVKAYPSSEGLAVYFRVVSERRKLDEQLRQSEERFRKIADATTDVISDWDLRTDAICVSAGAIIPH